MNLEHGRVVAPHSVARDFELREQFLDSLGRESGAPALHVHDRLRSAEDVLNTDQVLHEGRTDLLGGARSSELRRLDDVGRRGVVDLELLQAPELQAVGLSLAACADIPVRKSTRDASMSSAKLSVSSAKLTVHIVEAASGG